MKNSIALLVDSGVDLPKDISNQAGIYEVPLNIIYKDATYIDNVTITSDEIYARLDTEIPSTSLPDGNAIHAIVEQILADGYTQAIVLTISTGLSGTYNALKLNLEHFPQLETAMIDTKNITMGAALQGVYAKELIDSGLDLATIESRLNANIPNAKVYFSLPTLEYLKKGGRIGLVSSVIGHALNLHPVISCNEEGVYHTVTKARGRKRSLEKMIQDAEKFVASSTLYDIGVAHSNCPEDAKALMATIKERLPHSNIFLFDQVTPALGVHVGPDGVGFAIMKRD